MNRNSQFQDTTNNETNERSGEKSINYKFSLRIGLVLIADVVEGVDLERHAVEWIICSAATKLYLMKMVAAARLTRHCVRDAIGWHLAAVAVLERYGGIVAAVFRRGRIGWPRWRHWRRRGRSAAAA